MKDYPQRPFSIRIYLPDGRPDGLRIVDKSNWTGRAMVFPRALLPEAKKRQEFGQAGVYVLVGPAEEEGELPLIYIGEGDVVRTRLESHYSAKDFWTWAVFFVSKDSSLNKAHVQHLEARLYQLAREAKRAKLDNGNAPQLPALAEAEQADMESFLADMLSIFPLLGLNAFERPPTAPRKQRILTLTGKGITARGYPSGQGFVVLKGSSAVVQEVNSIHHYMTVLRKELLEGGVLVPQGEHWMMVQDYVFDSPSTAAGVMLGRSANGRIEWKDQSGKTLRELQELEAVEET